MARTDLAEFVDFKKKNKKKNNVKFVKSTQKFTKNLVPQSIKFGHHKRAKKLF